MLAKQQANQNKQINEILVKVPFLSELEDQMLSKIIDALNTEKFKKGELIFKKGDIGDMFYILESGTAKVHDIGFGDTKFDDIDITSGAYFGERALLTGEPRAANVTATSDCTCLALSRDSSEATLGPLQALIDRSMTKRVLVRRYILLFLFIICVLIWLLFFCYRILTKPLFSHLFYLFCS